MGDAVPGPSIPKGVLQEYNSTQILTESDLEVLLNISESDEESFPDSESESYDSYETSSNDDENTSDIEDQFDSENNVTRNHTDLPIWTDNPNLKNFAFTGIPGLKVDLSADYPIDFFRLFLSDNLLQNILVETNRYAEELFLSKERRTNWKPLTVPTLKVFLGLLLHMGHIQINRLQDYWKTDELYNLTCFRRYMGRNRFLNILKCLHFSKNPERGEEGYGDRLSTIRWLQDFFNDKVDEIYYPNKQLSLDESMVLWRERLIFRQYIRNKHKFGVKLYILSEPNGLVLKLRIYTGEERDLRGGLGHSAAVVLCLTKNYVKRGHSLYMDNFYNSFTLSKELLLKQTYVTGTLRRDRELNPREVIAKKLKKGDIITKYSNGVAIGKWRGKGDVLFISTEFDSEMLTGKNKRGVEKAKPKALVKYNSYMSGVDRQDQMLAYYATERKTIRWQKKIGIHIISMMLLNSHHLYNKFSSQKKLNYYDFRHNIIKNLLLEAEGKRLEASKIQVNILPDHLPEKFRVDDKGRQIRKRCRVCYEQKTRKNTPFFCAVCPDQPGLCLGNCFRMYHVQK